MNNNKIKNPQMQVAKGTALNEKDYITTLMSNLKELTKNYAVALTEASNEVLYQEYKKMFDQYSSLQREVYEIMFRKGFYVLEQAEEQKVMEKYQTLNQEFTDLTV